MDLCGQKKAEQENRMMNNAEHTASLIESCWKVGQTQATESIQPSSLQIIKKEMNINLQQYTV